MLVDIGTSGNLLPGRQHHAETRVYSLVLCGVVIVGMPVNLCLDGLGRVLVARNLLVEVKLLALQLHHFIVKSLSHCRVVEVVDVLSDGDVVGLHKPCLVAEIAVVARHNLLKRNHGTLLLVVAVGIGVDNIGELHDARLLLGNILVCLLLHIYHVLVCCPHLLDGKQVLISSLVVVAYSLGQIVDAGTESKDYGEHSRIRIGDTCEAHCIHGSLGLLQLAGKQIVSYLDRIHRHSLSLAQGDACGIVGIDNLDPCCIYFKFNRLGLVDKRDCGNGNGKRGERAYMTLGEYDKLVESFDKQCRGADGVFNHRLQLLAKLYAQLLKLFLRHVELCLLGCHLRVELVDDRLAFGVGTVGDVLGVLYVGQLVGHDREHGDTA